MGLEIILVEGGVIPDTAITDFVTFFDGMKFVLARRDADNLTAMTLWLDNGVAIFSVHTEMHPPLWLPAVAGIATQELKNPVVRAFGFSTGIGVVTPEEVLSARLTACVCTDGAVLFAVKGDVEGDDWEEQSTLPPGTEFADMLVTVAKDLWGPAWELVT